MTTDDIVQLCRKAVSNVSYYDLKRGRTSILELIRNRAALTDLALFVLDDTVKVIDDKLKQFSDEEKEIYDAVYGDNI